MIRATTLALISLTTITHAQQTLTSPNHCIEAKIFADPTSGLSYTLTWHGKLLAPPSHIGLRLQQGSSPIHELGSQPTFGQPTSGTISETYPFLGAKSQATNHANTLSLPLTESDGTPFILEARAYDDGFALRILFTPPTPSPTHILEETSTFTLPNGEVWFGERNNAWKLKSYAGEFHHTAVDNLPVISSQGPIQTAPLVVELPAYAGYALITEASLTNFSGMRLRSTPNRILHVDFTESTTGFDLDGPVTTPWRVTMLCADLNCLVNSTLTENLNSPPDPALFPDTTYIRPGRAVWRFMSRQTGTPEQEKQFVDYAAALGYEYAFVDDGWKLWPTPWPSMTELAAYARAKDVGVFAWIDSNELEDPTNNHAALHDFLDHAVKANLAGVKIDFLNSESKKKIDFQTLTLRLAAERHLMVDFHGIQKPTGEERTYPNGLSREGVRGIELNHMAEGPIPASHNAALPFTRMAIGPADYTPLDLTWPGPTTWTHQLATTILLSAPLLVLAEDPELLLKSPDTAPVLPIIRSLPATWDESIVLPGSHIGAVAGMARRKGDRWFVAVINGSPYSATMLSLPASLHLSRYRATVITSPSKRTFTSRAYHNAALWQHRELLASADGLVAIFQPLR